MWPFSRHLGIKAAIHAAKSRFFLYLVSINAFGDYIRERSLDRVYSCKRGDHKYLYPSLRSAAPLRPRIGLGDQCRGAATKCGDFDLSALRRRSTRSLVTA
jgi:hypothetical protein